MAATFSIHQLSRIQQPPACRPAGERWWRLAGEGPGGRAVITAWIATEDARGLPGGDQLDAWVCDTVVRLAADQDIHGPAVLRLVPDAPA